jgi:hypothetical protein
MLTLHTQTVETCYHHRAAREAIRYRPELHPERVATLHERALSMGEDDPLKPDYSRFLKAAKRRNLVSNAIPLVHGHLGSLLHHRARIGERAVIALQV